jgi:hypothetical protein
MSCLQFDPVKREIVIANDDFALTDNPSVQNGAVLLYGKGTNLLNPIIGVGIQSFMNSGMPKVAFQMNRWQQMAKNDGATIAKWTASGTGNTATIDQYVSYE